MKTAIGITWYHPNECVINRVCRYANIFDYVYIYDNTENIRSFVPMKENIKYYSSGENDGLCVAYNYILDMCIKDDVDYLCTSDQDSDFSTELLVNMIEMVKGKDKKTCIISPRNVPLGKQIKTGYRGKYSSVEWCICSGSFIDISIIKKYKIKYDEAFFIDRFDQGMCKDIKKCGYNIVLCNNLVFEQPLGYVKNGKINHSALRHYYIFRNRFYYNSKYYSFFISWYRNLLGTIVHCLEIIVNEDKKISKLNELPVAIMDYLRGNMGKRDV